VAHLAGYAAVSRHSGFYFGAFTSGLVVRVPGYSPRLSVFNSRLYQIFYVALGLVEGPLSLVRINEELLERKVAAPV
jgi:hypothetical protein